MGYGDGSYASRLSEFLGGLDEPVDDWFSWYSILTLENLLSSDWEIFYSIFT